MLPSIKGKLHHQPHNLHRSFPEFTVKQLPALENYSGQTKEPEKKARPTEMAMKKLKKIRHVDSEEKEKENITEDDPAKENGQEKKVIKKIIKGEVLDRKKAVTDICSLNTKRINTKEKPPHRYKTTMLVYKHCLLLYGGLGCEKNLTWAKLSFDTMNWTQHRQSNLIKPVNTYTPCSPIYGHTLCQYKDLAIVYGGSCTDEINETTLINTRTMEITQGARCPFRRKEHASIVLGELMFVHGGLEARETKSDMFVYHIVYDKWVGLINNSGLPALSSHRMVKGKNSKEIFMFGGLNSKSKSVNKMYRIKVPSFEIIDIRVQQIDCVNPPLPRHSFCLEKVSTNYIVLYGGREDNETNCEEQAVDLGVFWDVHLFNIDKKSWKRINIDIGLGSCFGMASTSFNGTVFIFGGSKQSHYADATINVVWNNDEKGDPWQCLNVNDNENLDSKKSSKFIHY